MVHCLYVSIIMPSITFACFRKKVVEKKHISCSITFFFLNRAVYEIMWNNIIELGRPRMTVWRIRISCWIPKATYTHLEHVILIDCPPQQWLHEHTSVLFYIYIARLVLFVIF